MTQIADPNTLRNDKIFFILQSETASLVLQLDDDRLSLASLTTGSNTETVTTPSAVALPTSYGKEEQPFVWQYSGYRPYDDGNGGVGYEFCFRDGMAQVTYSLYAVARSAMPGPFEFFATLSNEGTETLVFRPGTYVSVSFDSAQKTPTAWIFHKQSGIAEGWAIYSGRRFEGSGIYQTPLTNGLTVTIEGESTSEMIWITEAD